MSFDDLLINALKITGLDLRRKPRGLIRSQHEMSLTLEHVAAHFACRHPDRDVVVLQIGAYDGVANDPLANALELHGWAGVLVEPQRAPFEALARRYEETPGIQLFNVAIADIDGFRNLYRVEPARHLPDWTEQMASFDRAHVLAFEKYLPHSIKLDPFIVEELVECWTFDTLFRRAGIQHADVLQMDTEGYDLELLRLFDIPRRLPSIVNYEHGHLSHSERTAAASLLIANGYQIAMSNHADTVAYRTPGA